MKGSKKILALLLVLAMGMTMLAGCSSTPTATESPAATDTAAETPAASEAPAETRPNRLIYGSSTEVPATSARAPGGPTTPPTR